MIHVTNYARNLTKNIHATHIQLTLWIRKLSAFRIELFMQIHTQKEEKIPAKSISITDVTRTTFPRFDGHSVQRALEKKSAQCVQDHECMVCTLRYKSRPSQSCAVHQQSGFRATAHILYTCINMVDKIFNIGPLWLLQKATAVNRGFKIV